MLTLLLFAIVGYLIGGWTGLAILLLAGYLVTAYPDRPGRY